MAGNTGDILASVQREVDGLLSRIRELESQKTDLDKQISEVRRDIKKRQDLLLVWEGKADVRPMIERKAGERSRRGFTMTAAILEILDSESRPMSAHEILDELKKRNAAGTSKSPISSVRNALQILKKRNQIVSPAYGLVSLPGREGGIGGNRPPKTIRRPGGKSE
ncbi:hypothetical protein K8I61_10045 [bacterium]|nr:hypothetical protein [bacterium]